MLGGILYLFKVILYICSLWVFFILELFFHNLTFLLDKSVFHYHYYNFIVLFIYFYLASFSIHLVDLQAF